MNKFSGFLLINIYALVLIIAISIIFFSKKRLNQSEDKLYGNFLITSILVSLFGIILGVCVEPSLSIDMFIIKLFNKLYLASLISWIYVLTKYMIEISIDGDKKKLYSGFKLLYYLVIILIFLLPIEESITGNTAMASGLSVYLTYLVFSLDIIIQFICLFINHEEIKSKKYIPLYSLVVILILIVLIQAINPQLNYIINPSLIFVAFLMYFTIENPDVKMLEELYKNRKIIETSNEETSNFLFKITQDIKNPLKEIIDVSKDITDDNDISVVREKAKLINNLSNELNFTINDELDVSQMTMSHLKIYNVRYNPSNLFKEVSYKAIKGKKSNVRFESHISKRIPEYVYGDNLKLKQILNSIFDNTIKYTDSGFISLDVDVIRKYGICRFIIKISNSGKEIPIDKINDILSIKPSDSSSNLDKEILNLRDVKRLCMTIGGSFMIKSDAHSTVTSIVIEQRIAPNKENEIAKKLESYEQSLQVGKKIMVVDDDASELSEITSKLEKSGAVVSGSLFGRDVIEKVQNKLNYDLIILDDETSTYSALTVLRKLKENKNFNTPVMVMINDNKVPIKLEYLKDGFSDVIMKSKLPSELDRIMKSI